MVSTSGGLTHSGPSILPRSPFVAPSGDCNAKIKQDGTRTPYDYFNSPHYLLLHADNFVFTAGRPTKRNERSSDCG
ncbi:hypothetical protein T05_7685 [Trichinella murrelli]|uniref:Uncharacterized protein n=1 Tax=Trichinella murrelli TaxID=144512 RepID=A0A0V0T0B7_9BILA|nr:hypothetical protein T05_7685 [Trichinella murrelli]